MKKRTAENLVLAGVSAILIALIVVFVNFYDDSEPHIPRETPVTESRLEPLPEEPQEAPEDDFELVGYDCSNVPGTPVEGEPTPSVDVCDTEYVEQEEESFTPASPQHITIDAIGVDHPVVNVGLNPDGSMEIPHNVNELGWYEPGIKPGEYGSAVIAGHVDSRTQGPGAFFDLRFLEEGDEVHVTDEDGNELIFDVTRITRYDKNEIPMEEVFRWEGDSRDLVLITCGGAFDRTARSYEDNIVVYTTLRD